MAAPERPKKTLNLGLLALLFLFGLIIYLVRGGREVDEIKLFDGSVKFTHANIAGPEKAQQTSPQEQQARQAELEEKVRRLDEQLAARNQQLEARDQQLEARPPAPGTGGSGPPVLGVAPQVPAQMNVAGAWQGPQGVYGLTITQSGAALAVQWFEQMRGLIAVGQGQIQGQTINVTYSTVFGTQGVAQLQASTDGLQLAGAFRDMTTGYQGQLYLTR